MCKFRPGSGFFLGFAMEIEGKQWKTSGKRGEIQQFQGLSFLFAIFYKFSFRNRDGRTIPGTDRRFPGRTDNFWEEKTLKPKTWRKERWKTAFFIISSYVLIILICSYYLFYGPISLLSLLFSFICYSISGRKKTSKN